MWEIISNGDFSFMKKNDKNEDILKTRTELSMSKKWLLQLNFKAKHYLYCALSDDEYNRICGCETVKKIWDKLQVTYEGTSQDKHFKICMLIKEYEMFKMNEGEVITSMITRLTHIINNLRALDKTYSMEDYVQNVLQSLPESWPEKSIAIEEAKDLKKSKKEIGIALKSSSSSHKDMLEEDEDSEDDTTFFIMKLKKLLVKRRQLGKQIGRKKSRNNDSTKCYNCNKTRQEMINCPLNQNKENFQKGDYNAMNVAAWDEIDGLATDDEIEEEAHICFMDYEQEEVSSDDDDYTYDELAIKCTELFNELVFVKRRNKNLEEKRSKCSLEQGIDARFSSLEHGITTCFNNLEHGVTTCLDNIKSSLNRLFELFRSKD
ncbi:uncharacterized protein LOC131143830 [Malania oleifera]|uniref:uncharacterized protein LOC131143830 n=1 Tax=Malania oleifera TaxID=397392 RepID=UPI0025AE494E|nr:uncharacterized protein LOC131143830 [Malania oleifera]